MVPNGSGELQMVSGGWFWVVADCFGWLRMVSRGFRQFQVVCCFSNYGCKIVTALTITI